MGVHGLRNKVRVYILKKEPVYSKEDLVKIADKATIPIEWRSVYGAFLGAGMPRDKASEALDEVFSVIYD